MDIMKECDELLRDSDLFLNWMDRLPVFVEKLPESSRKNFVKAMELLDIFDRQTDDTHELKLAATYRKNQRAETDVRREEIKKEKILSRDKASQLAAQECPKSTEQVPEIDKSHRYGDGDTSFGEVPGDNTVALMSVEKSDIRNVRKSHRRSLSASASRAVRKVIALARSVSHGRKKTTLFD